MQSTASLERPLVFFDLETSLQKHGSEPGAGDIIQLAAISGGHTFNVYIMPQGDIDIVTECRTGFSLEDGKLFQNSKAVSTITLHEGLSSFHAFLQSFNLPILLAAHKDFALPILKKALIRCYLTQQFQELGSIFLDTCLLSKKLYPGLDSYEQEDLLYPFLGKPNNNHNALENVTALQSLYGVWNPNQESVTQCLI